MKTKSLAFRFFSFLCVIGIFTNTGVVIAQSDGADETPQPNTAPTIILSEPQQNIVVTQGDKISIVWEDEDPDDNAMIDIAYDVDNDPVNEENYHWIIQGLSEDLDGDGDRYEWDTTGVAAGTYYVWAAISDSTNAPVYALAAGTVTIQEVQVPIEEPTSEPPQAPIEEPTQEPTEEPTAAPTEEPTMEPTAVPTEEPTLEPTQTPTSEPSDDSQFHWKLELLGITPQMDAYNAVIQKLSSGETEVEASSESIVIQGSQGMGEIRRLLYTDLDGIISLIGDVAEIELEIPLNSTNPSNSVDPIEILLESNLSTGYRWTVISAKNGGKDIGFTENYTSREGIGVPFIQTITLHPTSKGNTSIKLLYARSFEGNTEITRRLTIQMNSAASTIDLSNPAQPTFSESEYFSENSVEESIDSLDYIADGVDSADTLPSSFDWRNYGGVTPIRNQKSCGSCWAFATVGAMESAMAIKTGKYFDLSEQFLVSCNKDGWSCAGGGTAHPYHYNKLGKSQTAVGAVLEAEKPYTNSNGTCTTAYNHPYVLSLWSSISSTTVANLKNAIYTYGPIKVSICAGPKFQDYGGGVFSSDESGYCSGTNHAVVLVGWNDATGSWILRNSWGTGWGESGYMRIKYGISKVGSYASWVTYAANTLPTLKSPSGTIFDTTPTYTWTKIGGARKYQYQLYQGSTLIYAKTVTSSVCGNSTCTSTPSNVLPMGNYQWRIGAYVDGAWQTFSSFKSFTLTLTPTPKTPSGMITDNTPTYTWSKIGTATKYQYQLYKGSTLVYAKTVTSSVCGTTTCTSTPSNVLSLGTYQWRVGAYVDGAWKTFSTYKTFIVSFTPTPTSPGGTISDTTPTYTWSKIGTATKYQYQLYKGSTLIYAKTVKSSVCGTTTCTSTPSNVLNSGDYQWRVGAYVNGAWQSFSSYKAFTMNLTPTPASPSGTISDTTPTYTWSKIGTATKYQYQLYKGSTLIYAKTVISSVCGTTTCTSTPSNVLNSGDYQWRVGAYVNGIWQPFSSYKAFIVNVTPTTSSPSGTIFDNTPTYTWSKLSTATKYQYQLYRGSTLVYAKTVTSSVCGTTTCTSTPSNILSAGDYQWRVGAYIGGAWQTFSTYKSFTLNLTPAPNSPSGTTYDTTPAYTWSKIAAATKYQYQLYQGATLIYAKTVLSSVCGSTTCTNTPTNVLNVGEYQWRVGAYVNGAWQTFSTYNSFIIEPGFNSQFTSDSEGWTPVSGTWIVENGYYKGTRTQNYFYSSAYDELFPTLTYEVKVLRSANMSMGIHFRGSPTPLSSASRWNCGYYFFVYNNTYSIGYFENGQYTAILNGPAPWTNTYTWTTLKVTANGSFAQFFINGTQVASGNDFNKFTTGKVGLEFYSDSTTSASMYVDWATLSTSAPSSITANEGAILLDESDVDLDLN
ncbi:MAG: C1 family peptidase [Anaerolineaceae bacterium]